MIKLKDFDNKRLLLMVFILLGLFTMSSCATTSCGQKYTKGNGMISVKGSVVKVMKDKSVYLCIGALDGAYVGQELEVWRTIYGEGTEASTPISAGSLAIGEVSESMVGKVKITKVLDDHYSIAEVMSGDAKLHDIVESKN
jgi:hypothetical protein